MLLETCLTLGLKHRYVRGIQWRNARRSSDQQSPVAAAHLIPIFRSHFGYFFPFLPTNGFSQDDDIGLSDPPYIINIMCALAGRFSPIYCDRSDTLPAFGSMAADPNRPNTRPSELWASKSKEQVHKNLAIASVEMVQALLLISWYEFGEDRDSVSVSIASKY